MRKRRVRAVASSSILALRDLPVCNSQLWETAEKCMGGRDGAEKYMRPTAAEEALACINLIG